MRRFRMLALGASVLALVLSACSTGGGSSSSASASKPKVIIGSANFYESALVGEIYAQALEAKGFTVDRKFNFGTRALTNAALKSGQLNLMPEYIGSDASTLKATATGDPQATFAALKAVLDPLGLTALNFAPGADQNGFAVRKETADQFSLKTLSDAAKVANQLKWGLPPECSTNASCGKALKDAYGIDIMASGFQWVKLAPCSAAMATALNSKKVDVGELCTTQPDIARFNFALLQDDKQSQGADNMVPVLRKDLLAAGGSTLSDTLNAISAKLTTDALTQMGVKVDVNKDNPATVAKQFLQDNGLI
ncbi:MAG: ABC transporter substrate-binding protein [Chloroflexi bacterium]|nr:MAG: ABC transporter substrate-binding protein [Chloroflexota bacterium]